MFFNVTKLYIKAVRTLILAGVKNKVSKLVPSRTQEHGKSSSSSTLGEQHDYIVAVCFRSDQRALLIYSKEEEARKDYERKRILADPIVVSNILLVKDGEIIHYTHYPDPRNTYKRYKQLFAN